MRTRILVLLTMLCLISMSLQLRAADTAITDDEALSFGKQLEAILKKGDDAGYKNLIDDDGMGARILKNVDLDEKTKKDFLSGFFNGFKKDNSLTNAVKTGGAIKFMRSANRDGMQCVILRYLPQSGGANYLFYALGKTPQGIRIFDLMPLSSGEWISVSTRQIALPKIVDANKGLLEKLVGTENEFVTAFPKFTAATQMIRQKNFNGALAELNQMPEGVRKAKIICLLRMSAAQQVGEKEHQAVLEEIAKWYTNDPAMNFLMIDAYFFRKDFEMVRKMVDSVDKVVGGDPYLNILRGNSYFVENKYQKAIECGMNVIGLEPQLAAAYDVVLESQMKLKDYPGVLETLMVFSKNFKVEPEAIANNPAYADFAASEAWKKYKAEKDKK